MKQQIDSFNYLIQEDLYNIVMADGNRTLTCDADPEWYMRYADVRVGSPTTQVNYVERRLTPHDCRLRDMTYSAPIHVRPFSLHSPLIPPLPVQMKHSVSLYAIFMLYLRLAELGSRYTAACAARHSPAAT